MADVDIPLMSGALQREGIIEKWVDQADGTFAKKVSVGAIPAGGNTIGRVAIVGSASSNSDNVSRFVASAASVNATLVKSSAGRIMVVTGINAAAAVRYLKLYNKATAPTVGTDVPRWTEVLPVGKFTLYFGVVGLYFSAGIGFGFTTAAADADTGAVAAADIQAFNMQYT